MRGSTDTKHAVGPAPGKPGIYRVKRALRRDWQLLLLCAVPILYFILFHYVSPFLIFSASDLMHHEDRHQTDSGTGS